MTDSEITATGQAAYLLGVERTQLALRDIEDPTEAARRAHRAAGGMDERVHHRAQRACAAGCAACCHFRVGVRQPEVELLLAAIQRHPERESIERSLRADRPQSGRCPLLDSDSRCRVHESRPLPCRGWAAFDRDLCNRHLLEPSVQPQPDATAFAIHLGVGEALDAWCASHDLRPGPTELREALLERMGETPNP